MHLEITAPLGVLGVARTSLPENTRVEFERTASVPGGSSPSSLVSGDGIESAVAMFRESPAIGDVSLVTETADGRVYRLTWGDGLPELIECVQDTAGTVLSAAAVDDSWTFELRFPDQNAASRFYTRYDDPDYPITIHKTSPYGPSQRAQGETLTAEQRDVLVRAVEAGYFEVPRRTTLVELANEVDISDTAVSQRLRRGLSNILRDATPRAPVRSDHRDD